MLLACFHFGEAQHFNCAADEQKHLLINSNQKFQLSEERLQQTLYRFLTDSASPERTSSGTYLIPVVFHLMHNNGPENVADAVLSTAIDQLNLRYQNAGPYYDSTGHPVNIQFCLASVDPSGNPTTGITRTVTPYTNFIFPTDDQALKSQIRWSPHLYLNIWVVNIIQGFFDGYSSFPFNAGDETDGIVIEYIYLTNSFLLNHETGHYFGLYHTFQNGCSNYNCLLNGDGVCDTPPDGTQAFSTCPQNTCTTELQDTTGLSPFPGDVPEVPNYMDYTLCPLSFTNGQVVRMETSTTLFRNELTQSNGCGNNPGQPSPLANFSFAINPCNDGTATFNSTSSVNSITHEWDFNADGLYEIIDTAFTYTFPSSGSFPVTLKTTGIGGQSFITQSVTVYKGSTYNYPIISYPQQITDTVRVCSGDVVTFSADPSGSSFLWNTGAVTADLTLIADSSMNIWLEMIDSTGFTWTTQCTPIYLEVFPSSTPVITYDNAAGYLCQGTPVEIYITNPANGTYNWFVYNVATGWVNTGVNDTVFTGLPDPTSGTFYYVTYSNPAGCNTQSNLLILQPQYLPISQGWQLNTAGLTLSYPVTNYTYSWYKDSVLIPGASGNQYTVTGTGCYYAGISLPPFLDCISLSDTVCFLFSEVSEPEPNSFSIFPNPCNDKIEINYHSFEEKSVEVSIISFTGQLLKQATVTADSFSAQMDVSELPSGTYILKVSQNENAFYRKLVKINPQ